MARIYPISTIAGISGKFSKNELLTFYTHKSGKIFAHNNRAAGDHEPTENQRAIHAKFSSVTALVNTELSTPEKLAEWQAKADDSNGKYTTARGACFASFWKTEEGAGE